MMDSALQELIKKIPPSRKPRDSKVNWERLERRVGLPYPKSFKEYIGTYGGGAWCDSWHPFYCAAKSDAELDDFMQTMSYHLDPLRERELLKQGSRQKLTLPLYPDAGGLLPFLIDFDNNCLFSWRTQNPDPDKWPVICYVNFQIVELRKITIAGMILEWLQRTNRMRNVWGDVRDVEEERIAFTNT